MSVVFVSAHPLLQLRRTHEPHNAPKHSNLKYIPLLDECAEEVCASQSRLPLHQRAFSWKISSCLKNLACGFRKMNRRRSVTDPKRKRPRRLSHGALLEQLFPREGVSPAQLVPCPRWTPCFGHTHGTDRARGELTVAVAGAQQ